MKFVCEGCNDRTLDDIHQTCPECGAEQSVDHLRAGWDESD